MEDLIRVFTADWKHLLIGVLFILLMLAFAWYILLQGMLLGSRLKKTLRQLQSFKQSNPALVKQQLSGLFKSDGLKAGWGEYSDTLHEQTLDDGLESRVAKLRATAPAETFFNAETVIDPVMHNEFFRHLPGIFTGIGIIGTFMGLIAGLQAFDPTAVDPNALKDSLGGLFTHVGDAFLISATAIVLAMACTLSEKWVYAWNVSKLGQLANALDALFEAGVGEEYLSQLVRSSEESATQTKQLKESLVEDLRGLLTNLTERQIAATQQLSADIGASLKHSLEEPLQKIADTVKTASSDQSEQAGRMIETLMAQFMTQMKESMGSQMGQLSQMMSNSAESMVRVEQSLRSLVDDMRQASTSSADGMRDAVNELLASLSRQQQESANASAGMQQQLLAQVQQAAQALAEAQEASARQMAETAARASAEVMQAAGTAQRVGTEALAKASQMHESQIVAVHAAVVELDKLTKHLTTLTGAMGSTFDRLDAASGRLSGMHEQMRTVSDRLDHSASAIRTTSDAMSVAAQSLNNASSRMETTATLIADEAQSRQALLTDLSQAMTNSQHATAEFSRYTETVSAGLEDVFDRFGKGTTAVLQKTLTDYDKQLAGAVGALADLVMRLQALIMKLNDEDR